VGNGFRKNTLDAGLGLGAGFGMRAAGSTRHHDLVLSTAHWGWVFTGVLFDDHWYRGNLEVLGEVFAGAQVHPSDRYVFGLVPALRYNLATGTRWVPFLEGGTGLSYTNIREPDLSTRFQFLSHGGAGVHCFVSHNKALLFRYFWLHLSNAGIEEPNKGVNTQMFMLGLSWFY
jgi:hypothetical protein